MRGFFADMTSLQNKAPVGEGGCLSCKLYSSCLSPKMSPSGTGKRKILFVAEAPGAEEDKLNTQLIGECGQELRKVLRRLDVDLDECRKTNAVICRPLNNATPTTNQITCCRKHLFDEVAEYNPRLVVLLGGVALESWWGGRPNDGLTIGRWRGVRTPDWENGCWVCPTFHPSYVMRQKENDSGVPAVWRTDLERALELEHVDVPSYEWVQGRTELLSFAKDVNARIEQWLTLPHDTMFTFDYETTGLKPHLKAHKVVCMSICHGNNKSDIECISFMATPKVFPQVQRFLKGPHRKEAANLSFEDTWSTVFFETQVRGWFWDTVLAAHVIDNRRAGAGTKYTAHHMLGIVPWGGKIASYIENENKKGNQFNDIHLAPEPDLLQYCGIDSIAEHLIGIEQRRILGYDMNDLLERGTV